MSSHAFWRIFGEGLRPALAIHGTLGHSGAWRGVGAALGSYLRLTAVDLPGHGRSPDPDRQGDFSQCCADHVRPFLKDSVDLIGHSFGATVAMRLAVENPRLIRSLTLIEPVYFAVLETDDPEALAVHNSGAAPVLQAVEQGEMAQAARLFNRVWGDGTRWAKIPAATRRYMIDRMHFVPEQSPMIFEDNAGLMRSGNLDRVSMPVLLMRGAKSPEVTARINKALALRLPDVRAVTIPGAGHMAPVTHPQAVAAEIRLLLKVTEKGVDLGLGN